VSGIQLDLAHQNAFYEGYDGEDARSVPGMTENNERLVGNAARRMARRAATAAPAAGNNLKRFSSPAALAQREDSSARCARSE